MEPIWGSKAVTAKRLKQRLYQIAEWAIGFDYITVNPVATAAHALPKQTKKVTRFLHGSVDPVARLVAQELSEKLETDVTLDLSSLHASDIQGSARAFQSLVAGGMPIAEAASVTGLISDD